MGERVSGVVTTRQAKYMKEESKKNIVQWDFGPTHTHLA
jgi:hypothetical protein